MEQDSHDDNARHPRRPRRRSPERVRPHSQGHALFCLEMLDAAFMDSDFRHRVVVGDVGPDGRPAEWIELDAPTELYANPQGDHRLTVTIRVEASAVRILAADVYPPGSLRSPPQTADRPGGSRQLLWLAHPRSGLAVELVADPSGRIDAILALERVRAFNRADVPRFVRSFASAIDLVEQTIRETGLREDRWGI